jgi:predicted CXXCH cytochrome family protein
MHPRGGSRVARGGPTIRVRTERAIRAAALAAAGLFAMALVASTLTSAFAATPPHVVLDSQRGNTDACAICHRAHTADASVPSGTPGSTQTSGTSLLIASDPAAGDVSLCLSCHGAAQLGSNSDVESHFLLSSVHGLAPAAAPYGPSPLYCSTCHDSHGDARVASDTPYPKLLRSYEGTRAVYTGEAYCATCHTVKAAADQGERWAGMDVYRLTGHYTGIPAPASGTGIRCSICHDPHGSAVAPLLAASLVPTSVATTFTVTADDRTFCTACHGPAKASWEGMTTYATSSHGSSPATVAISAKWVPGIGRLVGECQVCHAPMGRSDGSGGAIPKLLDAAGRTLCDRCHSSTGVAHSTDTSSQARPIAHAPVLAVVYTPAGRDWAGRVALYGRTAPGAGALVGPREYAVTAGAGPSAIGDIDGDGKNELVVCSPDSAVLTVLRTDPLTGLGSKPATYTIPAGSRAVAVMIANVVQTAPGWIDRPEIVLVTAAGKLVLCDWFDAGLQFLGSALSVGDGPWGLASGQVSVTPLSQVIVTDRSGGALFIASDNGARASSLTTYSIGGEPVAPSTGRLWAETPGLDQIAVCDAASTTSTVRLFGGNGVELAHYALASGAGRPSASAIGDLLWSVQAPNRSELAVAFTDEPSGDSSVVVVPQVDSGFGLETSSSVTTVSASSRGRTGALLIADVDSDGSDELVVGNGGTWATDASAQAPDLRIFRANGSGDGLADPEIHAAGGTELAGGVPSLALADLGPILPSRHPIDEVAPKAHVSTESASVERHVTCSDCHNSHEAVVAVTTAPAIQGLLRGAWGGLPSTDASRALTSYAVCFKCHSSYTDLAGRPDAAAQFAPSNASVHAVVEPSRTSVVATATFVAPWDSSSVLYCTDCHGDKRAVGAQSRDLHESAAAPLLSNPYLGIAPDAPGLLCYRCHAPAVYATGSADGPEMSGFYGATGSKPLHSIHVASAPAGHGISCGACHVSHGSATLPHLLRSDSSFAWTAGGAPHGGCTSDCHTDPATRKVY